MQAEARAATEAAASPDTEVVDRADLVARAVTAVKIRVVSTAMRVVTRAGEAGPGTIVGAKLATMVTMDRMDQVITAGAAIVAVAMGKADMVKEAIQQAMVLRLATEAIQQAMVLRLATEAIQQAMGLRLAREAMASKDTWGSSSMRIPGTTWASSEHCIAQQGGSQV